jgi:hypothetical protein
MCHDNVLTYRPVGCDGFEEKDCSLLSFSDSDWACALVLSTAAAEYYEGSEACRFLVRSSRVSWKISTSLIFFLGSNPAAYRQPGCYMHE